MKKAQLSTEYLIVLAVVLVLVLVVVGIMSGFPSLGTQAKESQSVSYWSSASPLSIKTYKASATTLDLVLVNRLSEKVTLTGVSLGTGASVFGTSTDFGPGEEKQIAATLASTCGVVGTQFDYANVTITYTKGTVSGLKEVGTVSLVGKCS
ncbi:MAG: hypothetical protein AABX38_05040 [Candidatus Micrarchaeota archaeon]